MFNWTCLDKFYWKVLKNMPKKHLVILFPVSPRPEESFSFAADQAKSARSLASKCPLLSCCWMVETRLSMIVDCDLEKSTGSHWVVKWFGNVREFKENYIWSCERTGLPINSVEASKPQASLGRNRMEAFANMWCSAGCLEFDQMCSRLWEVSDKYIQTASECAHFQVPTMF